MSLSAKLYVSLAVVFAGSLASYVASKNSEVLQIVFALPMAGSLMGGLFQVLRDMAAHERSLLLLDAQQHFALGASSHLATVAFDKHVLFTEAYLKEARAALRTLFREGPSQKILDDAGRLYGTRQDHIVWLTPQVEAGLDRFEGALRSVGATAGFISSTENSSQHQEQRQKAISSMYKTFAKVMAFPEWENEKLTDDLAEIAVIRMLRKLLGTEELTEMRQLIISKAITGLKART